MTLINAELLRKIYERSSFFKFYETNEKKFNRDEIPISVLEFKINDSML